MPIAGIRGSLRDAARRPSSGRLCSLPGRLDRRALGDADLWLFSFVLGHSRLIWAGSSSTRTCRRFLRCHMAAFEAIGGVPRRSSTSRMKTAVIGEGGGSIVYNRALIDFARHYGFQPKACRPYRAKTKGKVERPYRYIREDFFLARSFRNLDDLNAQLRHWLDTVANPRVHATTQCVVNEAFAAEQPQLGALPLASFRARCSNWSGGDPGRAPADAGGGPGLHSPASADYGRLAARRHALPPVRPALAIVRRRRRRRLGMRHDAPCRFRTRPIGRTSSAPILLLSLGMSLAIAPRGSTYAPLHVQFGNRATG